MNFLGAKKYILDRLEKDLPNNLTYHGYHHTIDVYNMSIDIAENEGITDIEELTLLKTGALYHDCGFLKTYKGHEDESCVIARESLVQFNYTPDQIETVCNLIHATRIPQSPQSKIEQILADADLDYLGRDDFQSIANSLFLELKSIGALKSESEWNRIQVGFLETHRYFTHTSIGRRKKEKQKRIVELKKLM